MRFWIIGNISTINIVASLNISYKLLLFLPPFYQVRLGGKMLPVIVSSYVGGRVESGVVNDWLEGPAPG